MSDPKPSSRNCAGCNEPNPPHEMIDQRCLRCTHRELIDCRNALQIMTNAEDDARRELVRVRLRLDWLGATSVAKDALKPLVEALKHYAHWEYPAQGTERAKNALEIARRLGLLQLTPPTPEPSRNTAGLHEPVWDSRNSDEPKTEVL